MKSTHLTYTSQDPFRLELGGLLPGVTIGYHTYGKLNEAKDNVPNNSVR